MKRLLLAALIGTASLVAFSGCTKEYNSYPVPSKTFIYTIKSNQWSSDDNKRILHDLNLPELTNYYLKQGSVTIAMSSDNQASYDILPASFSFNTGQEIIPISFSVNYYEGGVTIYGEDPLYENGVVVPAPNQDLIVKITLTDADYIE